MTVLGSFWEVNDSSARALIVHAILPPTIRSTACNISSPQYVAETWHHPETSRNGNWVMPPQKAYFHTLKAEQVHHQHYQTSAEAKQCIEVLYNRERLLRTITIEEVR